jgi:hypothetical protein
MVRTFLKRYALLGALLAVPLHCLAQKPNTITLIPAANWREVDSQSLPLEAIRNYGGDPIIDSEYGVKSFERRIYQLGSTRVDVVIEPATDPTAAYGLLTYYQTSTMTTEKGIQLAVGDAQGALMARGRNFIKFFPPKELALSDNDYLALLIYVGGTRPSARALESLPAPMPAAGLLPGTEKYLLGPQAARRVLPDFRTDLLGFDQGAEAQVADYLSGRVRSTVLAISYPTPQIARIRFGAMKNFLDVNQDRGKASIYGRREGSFVFLVLNAGIPQVASNLMNEFKVASHVSWDERYPGDKPFTLQILELILSNIMLILILVGICIAGGLLLFLSKRLVFRYFPGTEWANPEGEHLIRLNLQ